MPKTLTPNPNPQVLPHLHELRTPSGGKYFPVVFFNDFWVR